MGLVTRFAAVLGLLCAFAATGSSWSQIRIEELAVESEVVFEGLVIGKKVTRTGTKGRIFTEITFEVIESIKGEISGRTLSLRFLGGSIGDETLSVTDMRHPDLGERGIYFVESMRGDQVNPLCGWDQGRILIENNLLTGRGQVTTSSRRPIYAVLTPEQATSLHRAPNETFARGLRLTPREDSEQPLEPAEFKRALHVLVRGGSLGP